MGNKLLRGRLGDRAGIEGPEIFDCKDNFYYFEDNLSDLKKFDHSKYRISLKLYLIFEGVYRKILLLSSVQQSSFFNSVASSSHQYPAAII